jgi:hypothetical protein
MFSFPPISEEEAEKEEQKQLAPIGKYGFEVLKTYPKFTKNNEPKTSLFLRLRQPVENGFVEYTMFDDLVFNDKHFNRRKIRHFCESVGHPEWAEKGSLPKELGGYGGECDVGFKPGDQNPNGGHYPDKNIIIDYIKPTMSHKEKVEEFESDPLPF